MLGKDNLEDALRTLGAVLESRGLSSRILVAGGSSLLLLGLIDRPTADVDVIGLASGGRYVEPTPEELLTAARWTRTHDPSEGFKDELVKVLTSLGVEASDADL